MQRTHTNRPFTLIELMVVIGIMIIILSLSAPAFRKLAMGSSVDIAARMVSSQLMLARAEAISRRECIAVVMPDDRFNKDSNDTSVYPFTAFRSAIVIDNNNGTFTFKEWVPNTNWSFLPTGAVIRGVRNAIPNGLSFTNGNYSYTSSSYQTGSYETISDTASQPMVHGKTNSNVPCVIFKKTGKAVGQSFVTIAEGVYTDGTEPDRVNLDNIHFLEVNQYTGQTKFIKFNYN